jgi:hypothetical protein
MFCGGRVGDDESVPPAAKTFLVRKVLDSKELKKWG